VPDDYIAGVFDTMQRADWHTFQVLTKRPERTAALASRLPWPKNVWMGTSVENQRWTCRIEALQTVPAAVRFLSCEPLLGPLTLDLTDIHWVIAGGESGPRSRAMKPEWAEGIRDQCLAQGVSFFFKQWGAWNCEGRRVGKGSHIVVCQRDNVIGLVGEFMVAQSIGRPLPIRASNRDADFAPHNVYRAKDEPGRFALNLQGVPVQEHSDAWIAIAVDSDEAWNTLCRVVGGGRLATVHRNTLSGRRDDETAIDRILSEWAAERDATECATLLQAAGVSAAPVLSPLMLLRDAHLHERGFFPHVVHPEAGKHLTTRPVWRLARRPLGQMRPAPCFGQHNEEVLRTLAGCTNSQIAAMRESDVIATEPR